MSKEDANITTVELKIKPLSIGGWKSWQPRMIAILQSQGLSKWLDTAMEVPEAVPTQAQESTSSTSEESEGSSSSSSVLHPSAPVPTVQTTLTWRQMVSTRYRQGKMEAYEYLQEMQGEERALGLIRRNIEWHLAKEISSCSTVPQAMEALKKTTNIVNGASIEVYTNLLWNMQLHDISDAPQHVQVFEEIVESLQDNNSGPTEVGKKEAWIKSWTVLMPQLAESHRNDAKMTYEHSKIKILEKAQASIVMKALIKSEPKPQVHITENHGTNFDHDRNRRADKNKRKNPHPSGNASLDEQMRSYTNLADVPQYKINRWKRHLDEHHQCTQGANCWFKLPTAPYDILNVFRNAYQTKKPRNEAAILDA